MTKKQKIADLQKIGSLSAKILDILDTVSEQEQDQILFEVKKAIHEFRKIK